MTYALIDLIWIFVIYAFLGWCLEVIYAAVTLGKFVNRGFLNGPFCPIYGFGLIVVLTILEPFKANLLLLFVGSVLLTTALELITGLILERIFNQKWWDYTDIPYNFMGYVCLGQSLAWGLACVFVIYILQPFINNFIEFTNNDFGRMTLSFIIALIALDVIVTLIVLLNLKKKYILLKEVSEKIRNLSNVVGRNISDNAKNAIKAKDRNLQELELLRRRYQSILEEKAVGYRRILKAFPKLRSVKPKKIPKK